MNKVPAPPQSDSKELFSILLPPKEMRTSIYFGLGMSHFRTVRNHYKTVVLHRLTRPTHAISAIA